MEEPRAQAVASTTSSASTSIATTAASISCDSPGRHPESTHQRTLRGRRKCNEQQAPSFDPQRRARQRRRHRRIARARGRRHVGTADQCRQGAAQLADEPPHLRRAALFAARQDQQGQRHEPQARLRGRHRWHLRQREPAGDAARRGRLPLRRRSVGRGLQDRRALGRHGPHRLAHGPRPGEAAAVEPRRRAGATWCSPPPTIRPG